MKTEWHGKDWREYTCGKCGYISCWTSNPAMGETLYHGICRKSGADLRYGQKNSACPDFEHRDVPDPDERTNLEHIREEDRL